MDGDFSAGLPEKFWEKQKCAEGRIAIENTSESLSLLYCFALLPFPPSYLSPDLWDGLSREGQVGRRRGGCGSGKGRQDPPRLSGAGSAARSAGAVASSAQASLQPRAARAGRRLSATRGKSSLIFPGPLPSGQVCSATPPLPVWKPLQPQIRMGKVPDGFPLHLAVQCFALLVCKSTK